MHAHVVQKILRKYQGIIMPKQIIQGEKFTTPLKAHLVWFFGLLVSTTAEKQGSCRTRTCAVSIMSVRDMR